MEMDEIVEAFGMSNSNHDDKIKSMLGGNESKSESIDYKEKLKQML